MTESRLVEVAGGHRIHVGVTGAGADVLILTGGPGCVQYLDSDNLAPRGRRCWYPEPRGVGRSEGGPHTMAQAVADLEHVRIAVGVEKWTVVGHSWGSDLAVRYALEEPEAVSAVVGICGRGPQRDATWSAEYEAGRGSEPQVEIAWDPAVHSALSASFTAWIHQPGLWRALADCAVPMHFVAAADDIRPCWPLQQLAALVRDGSFEVVPGVPHDFWSTHPQVWLSTLGRALTHDARSTAPEGPAGRS